MKIHKYTTEQFIELSNKADRFDYDKTNYKGRDYDVIITCKLHGDFKTNAGEHRSKKHGNCPACKEEFHKNRDKGSRKAQLKTTEQFILDSKKIHGDRYIYDLVDYNGSFNKVEIMCRIHGSFMVMPSVHLSGKQCNKCSQVTRLRTKVKNGNASGLPKTDFEKYRKLVNFYTNKQPITDLPHYEKRGSIGLKEDPYHLDHKFSIVNGFKMSILPYYIGHIHNLEFIPASDNYVKNRHSSITYEELFSCFDT